MLEATNLDLYYGAAQALRGISIKAEPGKVTCVLGRKRRRQDAACCALWSASARSATAPSCSRARTSPSSPPSTAPATASPMCRKAARSSRCSRCRRTWKPAYAPLPARSAQGAGRRVHAVPGAAQHARPARRRPVRRPAAAIGHRPRADYAAAAAAARRANRRHPALDHQGYRPRHRLSALAQGHGDHPWSSSISTSRRSSATSLWSWIAAPSSIQVTKPIWTRRRSSARWRFDHFLYPLPLRGRSTRHSVSEGWSGGG